MTARAILSVAMLLYLTVISVVLIMMPKALAGLAHAGALLVLCAFGAWGLSRMRVAAIAAIGIAAVGSVALLGAFVMQGKLTAIVKHSGWRWQFLVVYGLAFMLYEAPVAAFLIVWPLRRGGAGIVPE